MGNMPSSTDQVGHNKDVILTTKSCCILLNVGIYRKTVERKKSKHLETQKLETTTKHSLCAQIYI